MAVRLQYVAVQGNGAFPQLLHIHRLTQAAADQPLNFHAAAIFFDAVPGLAAACGRGQHGVFRRYPAPALVPQEGGHVFLHAGGADYPGFTGGNQAAASGGFHKAGLNGTGTGLTRGTKINALHVAKAPYNKQK